MLLNNKTKVIAIIVLVVVVGSAYFLTQRYWWGTEYVPEGFVEAREGSALVAEKIVFLAHQSLAGLEQIAQLDEQKKYSKALEWTKKELERNKDARREALFLSSQLGTMAAYLSEIEPARGQSLATEAVGHEVNLVSHLLTFHGLLSQLFELLSDKFSGRVENNDTEVQRLVDSINREIRTINDLNTRFGALMKRFDRVYE